AEPYGRAVLRVEHRLDELAVVMVVDDLAVAGVRGAVGSRSRVWDAGGAAVVAAVGRLEDRVAASLALGGIGGHEHLVLLPGGEPRPVAVVAVGVALVPGVPTVVRGEDGVVHQVD